MKWRKQGLIYVPDGQLSWAKTHAIAPTPILFGDKIRLYFSSCDDQGIGRPGYIDVSAENPNTILDISKKPLFDVGLSGTFDDNGILITSIVNLPNGHQYFYYVGFEICTKIRYRLLGGLAYTTDQGKTFQRFKNNPILERSNKELYFRGGPFVLLDEGIYKLWYVAGSEWIKLNNKEEPVYSIHYLESDDGLTWLSRGLECLPISKQDEHAFGRPYVLKENGLYKLFYSIRIKYKGYRLGYAESENGINWQRKDDEMGLDVSDSGWDSETVCYSAPVRYQDKTYLFYNGNGLGRSGFGYATLE